MRKKKKTGCTYFFGSWLQWKENSFVTKRKLLEQSQILLCTIKVYYYILKILLSFSCIKKLSRQALTHEEVSNFLLHRKEWSNLNLFCPEINYVACSLFFAPSLTKLIRKLKLLTAASTFSQKWFSTKN